LSITQRLDKKTIYGLTLLIFIKSPSCLFTQPAGLNISFEQRTGPVFCIFKSIEKRIQDCQTGIQSDEIRQCQGPHGMVRAQFHDRVDTFTGTHTMIQAIHRFIDHGHEYSIDDKTGIIICLSRCFTQLYSQVPCDFKRASVVRSPRIISISFITGTGFIKCIPIIFPGRPVWDAIRPMGMEDVLVARIT